MNASELKMRETAAGLEIRLHVQPRAKRPEVSGIHNGALKLKVVAPPVDDAANRAVVEFVSSWLGVPKSSIHIASGLRSREKSLLIRGLSLNAFRAALESM